jgi:hypothetical protein
MFRLLNFPSLGVTRNLLIPDCSQNTLIIHVILNGAQLRYESRRLKKRDSSLAQNDKYILLIAFLYNSHLWAFGPPANDEKWLAVDHGARCVPHINLEL